MTVTGSNWQQLTLGKLIPTLDPDKKGSLASRTTCEMTRIQSSLDENITKTTNLIDSAAVTLKSVEEMGIQIAVLQNEIEDLVSNAINTGVYMHTLGLNPIFSLTSPGSISEEIARTFGVPRAVDPNVPMFKGDGLAIVGGVILLISAPNVAEMVASLQRLGVIFPIFAQAASAFADASIEIPDIITDEMISPLSEKAVEVGNAFANFQLRDLYSAKPFTKLFEQFSDDTSIIEFDGFETRMYDKWYALRLSDLIPALNPALPGSPAEAIMNAERALVKGGVSLLSQVGRIGDSVRQIGESVNFLNRSLNTLASNVKNLVKAVGQTGMYVHIIGLDGTVTTSEQFIDACRRALHDFSDSNRPRAAGGMVAFAGMQLVFGAANPKGLKKQFDTIGTVFGGIETNIKNVGKEAKDLFGG